LISTITVDKAIGCAAISPQGDRLYVAYENYDDVAVIDTLNATVVQTIHIGGEVTVGHGPSSIAIAPDGSRVYVARQEAQQIAVIDSSTNSVIAGIPITGYFYSTIIGPSLNGGNMYVSTQEGTYRIDTAANAVTPLILGYLIPAKAGAISPDGRQMYLLFSNAEGAHALHVVDTESATVIATVDLPLYSTDLALSQDGRRAYVGYLSSNEVTVIDTGTS
jgi:YVTN family beta-propeller protein